MYILELRAQAEIESDRELKADDIYFSNDFFVDLAPYQSVDMLRKTHAYVILPKDAYEADGKIWVRIYVYFNKDIKMPLNEQIRLICDYVSGQCSDGWGENGFECEENALLVFPRPWLVEKVSVSDRDFSDVFKDREKDLNDWLRMNSSPELRKRVDVMLDEGPETLNWATDGNSWDEDGNEDRREGEIQGEG